MSNITNRRSFLKVAPAAAAVAAVPVVAYAQQGMAPDERIASAMAELGAALEAKYPGWLIDVQQPHNRYTTSVPSMERRVDTEVLIVSAIEPRAWQHRVAWHWEEGGPLLADDVTGTTAYADWAAKQGAKA